MPRGWQSETISTPSRSRKSQRSRLARGSRHTCAPRGMGCARALCAMRAKQLANERPTHTDREPRTSRSLREATASAARTVEVSRSSCSFPRPDSGTLYFRTLAPPGTGGSVPVGGSWGVKGGHGRKARKRAEASLAPKCPRPSRPTYAGAWSGCTPGMAGTSVTLARRSGSRGTP